MRGTVIVITLGVVVASGACGAGFTEADPLPGGAGGSAGTPDGGNGQGGGAMGGAGTGGQGGGAPPCAEPNDACEICALSECNALFCMCQANPACVSMSECVDGCTDPTCITDCYSTHADGYADSQLLDDCGAKLCYSDCGGAPLSDCMHCILSTCPAEANACYSNPECSVYRDCFTTCAGDQACIANCGSTYPTGSGLAFALGECVALSCGYGCLIAI